MRAVSRLLDQETQGRPLSPKRRQDTAQIFLDVILLPILFRSLLGEKPSDLNHELAPFMQDRVGFVLAGYETG